MWNENTILDRAREIARTYCDEDRIALTDVRAEVQEFCLNTRAIYGSETITTVANQRVYPLLRVFEIVRVKRGSTELPHSYRENSDSYQVRPSQIVLNYNPPANQTIVVEGFIVPANVSDIHLQPEIAWMDAIAYGVAARVLARYGDPQAVERSRVFRQTQSELVADLLRRLVQPYAPRVSADEWSIAYIVHKSREYLHPFGLASLATESECETIVREFFLSTRAYFSETTHLTIANETRYALGDVIYPTEVVYDGATIPMQYPAPYTQSWYAQHGQLVLNFEPAAGKSLVIRGYGVPSELSSVKLEPADVLMDAVASKVAAELLLRYRADKDSVARAQYLLTKFASAVSDVQSRMHYSRLERNPRGNPARRLSLQ